MSVWRTAVTLMGGVALIAATATDTIAVIGRHVGMPVHGSIELVQVAVLVAGSLALLVATVAHGHAKVHLLVDRMGDNGRAMVDRIGSALTAVFFAALLAGSVWLAADLWAAHEMSEVVGVPWRWMRLFANIALGATIIVLVRQVFAGRAR
ncbi:MAG: hypothetical protein RIS85_1890 [Pseudomonadota bacterium]